MFKAVFAACVVLAALLTGACKSSTGPSADELEGTWTATSAEFVLKSDTSTKVDIVDEGSTVTLVLGSSTFTLTTNDTRPEETSLSGTWSKTTDTLTLAPAGADYTIVFDMALSGSTLTLEGGGVMFDFTSTGTLEDAELNMVLAKS
jgi:hypothetical protein